MSVNISIILLAAGSSRRFGGDNKLLATFGRAPIIRTIAETLLGTSATELVVVTGANPEPIRQALEGLSVRCVDNPNSADGIGTSIAAGVRSVDARVAGVMIVPGDMPLLTAELVDSLIVAFEAGGARRAVHPVTTDGEQRNPVIWPRRYFAELARLSADRGAKELLSRPTTDTDVVVVGDQAVFTDIDTQDDLANLQRDIQITKAQDAP